MKFLKLALCAATASFAMAGAAAAQEVSFNVGVTSDYVFRGVSQADEKPALQGGVDVTGGIFYGGLWASNVDFYDSTDAEIDAYVGVTPSAGPVSFDFGAIYYGYVNQPSGADYDFWEFKAAASVPAGPATLGAAIYYSPEFFGGIGDATYYEVNAEFSPAEKWTLSAAVGEQTFDAGGDYSTWNAGVGYAFTDKLSADLRYHDNDIGCGTICDSRVTLSLTATLP
ncbi:MAG: TorF family putative porin [Caulobacter sp.]|nr:TorF family putative porin [Caulobacter sp.]MDP1961503.1 TorF family putative porin [Reyranella sp.]